MAVKEFTLPDVGEGVAEGELVEWLVEPGDRVTTDQPVAEVETDKALVEVPSPYDGTVRELRAAAGEMIPVGGVIATVAVDEPADGEEDAPADGAQAAADDSGGDRPVPAPPSVRRLARELGVDLAGVDGSGPGGRVTEGDVRAAARDEGGAPAPRDVAVGERESAVRRREEGDGKDAADEGNGEDGEEDAPRPRDVSTGGKPSAVRRREEESDDAARRAEEATAAAVEAVTAALGGGTADDEGTDPPAAEARSAADAPSGERVPYRGVRRAVGDQMARSKHAAPHVTHHDEVEVSRLVETRAALNEVCDVHLTYVPFVMKAVVAGLEAHPYVNARLDEEAGEILLRDEYNLGVATATDAGVMVPVVENVDEKDVRELAAEVAAKVERAREGEITRSEMQGGTFTVSNVGAVGGEYQTPIVNHPEVAILGLGAVRERPWVDDGEVVARHTLPLSLSVDNRVVDGAVAAKFTNGVAARLSRPEQLLL